MREDATRPCFVSQEERRRNHDRIFGKKRGGKRDAVQNPAHNREPRESA